MGKGGILFLGKGNCADIFCGWKVEFNIVNNF